MDGYLQVRVNVPLGDYRRLNAEAEARGITVAERIAQVLCPPQHGGRRKRAGIRSGYSTLAGEEISAGRRFGTTWTEIARQLGISDHTARTWLAKYETEVREQNMRDSAERKTA
jgi:DNA invertase Pin-like site-specific DNA recombinase